MLVLRTFVDIEISEHLAAESRLGQHAFDGVLEDESGLTLQHVADITHALATRITRVVHIVLLGHLVARQHDLLCIDNDDIIATIAVGSVACLLLATQNHGNLSGQATEDLAFSVDDVPLLVGIFFVDADCFVT